MEMQLIYPKKFIGDKWTLKKLTKLPDRVRINWTDSQKFLQNSQVAFLLTASILCLNHVQIDSSLNWCKSKSSDANSHFARAGPFKTNHRLLRAECEREWIVKSCVRLLGLVVSVYRAFILNAPLKKKK